MCDNTGNSFLLNFINKILPILFHKIALNIIGKPDALVTWDGLLDMSEQDVLKEDCIQQACKKQTILQLQFLTRRITFVYVLFLDFQFI